MSALSKQVNGVGEKSLRAVAADLPFIVQQVGHGLTINLTPDDIADYSQQLSLKLLEKNRHRWRSFLRRSNPRTWLYRVARRYIARQRKRAKPTAPLEDLPPHLIVTPPTQETQLLADEQLQALRGAVAQCTPRDREFYRLFYTEELSVEEVAERMETKPASVHHRNCLLKEKLRGLLLEGGGGRAKKERKKEKGGARKKLEAGCAQWLSGWLKARRKKPAMTINKFLREVSK